MVKMKSKKHIVSAIHKKYSYESMEKDIFALKEKYPNYFHYQVIGKSEDSRELYEATLGNANADRNILVIAAIHGREYMTTLLCMKQIEYYLSLLQVSDKNSAIKRLFENMAIRYIPMANPDGVAISQFGIKCIQKKEIYQDIEMIEKINTNRWKANAKGVDLNRNFPYHFYVTGTKGGEGYSGEEAVSENESKAILNQITYLEKEKGLQAVIHYHAMGSEIFGSCQGKSAISKRTVRMFHLAKKITGYPSAARKKVSIFQLDKEKESIEQVAKENPYSDNGNLREYLLYQRGLPSITIEIGHFRCPGPVFEFPFIWKRNKDLILQEAYLLNNMP